MQVCCFFKTLLNIIPWFLRASAKQCVQFRGVNEYLNFCSPTQLRQVVQDVKGQLKKIAITASNRKDKVFLGINMSRQGHVGRDEIRQLCQRQYLPSDDAVVDAVSFIGTTVSNLQQFKYESVFQKIVDIPCIFKTVLQYLLTIAI